MAEAKQAVLSAAAVPAPFDDIVERVRPEIGFIGPSARRGRELPGA